MSEFKGEPVIFGSAGGGFQAFAGLFCPQNKRPMLAGIKCHVGWQERIVSSMIEISSYQAWRG